MRAALLAVACAACNGILGIPEPQLVSQTIPDARVDSDARLQWKLTVVKDTAAAGKGTVTADMGGLDCGEDCPTGEAVVDPGRTIKLVAKPAPGSYFQGWSGACTGSNRFCTVTLDVDQKVATATFAVNDRNLIFATSQHFKGNFGGVAAADAKCDTLAKAAGLSGTFVALLSATGVNARDRLVVPGTSSPPRGFVRMDGKPIADTVADLVGANVRLWYPVRFDENGADNLTFIWSGSKPDGTVAPHCDNWTSTTIMGQWGDSSGGPGWLSDFVFLCDATNAVYCVQVDNTVPVQAPSVAVGKKIFVSKAFFSPGGGLAAADTLCSMERPGDVPSVLALLPTTDRAASSLIQMDALYVRPDGILVGRGVDLATPRMVTAPWVHGDGTYASLPCCTLRGSGSFASVPIAAEVCNNWTSNSSAMNVRHGELGVQSFWTGTGAAAIPCASSFPIYCVEPP